MEEIFESKLKSNIEKDFKLNEIKNISNFKKVSIDDSFIRKYKKSAKLLKNADKSEFGFTWFDDDKMVGYCMANEYGWLTAIEVSKAYRGYGIGEQILEYALTHMGINRLGVHDDNQVAMSLYKKYGFKEVPSKLINGSNQRHMIFMTSDDKILSSYNQSTLNESVKDVVIHIYESEINGDITEEERDFLFEKLDVKATKLLVNAINKVAYSPRQKTRTLPSNDQFKMKMIQKANKHRFSIFDLSYYSSVDHENPKRIRDKLESYKLGVCYRDKDNNAIVYSFVTGRFYFFDHRVRNGLLNLNRVLSLPEVHKLVVGY